MVPDRVCVCCLIAALRGPSPLLLFASFLLFLHFSPVSGALFSGRGTRGLTPFAVPLAASSLRRAVRLGLETKSAAAGAARTAAVRTPAAPAHWPAAVTSHCVNTVVCKKHNKKFTLKSTNRHTLKNYHISCCSIPYRRKNKKTKVCNTIHVYWVCTVGHLPFPTHTRDWQNTPFPL